MAALPAPARYPSWEDACDMCGAQGLRLYVRETSATTYEACCLACARKTVGEGGKNNVRIADGKLLGCAYERLPHKHRIVCYRWSVDGFRPAVIVPLYDANMIKYFKEAGIFREGMDKLTRHAYYIHDTDPEMKRWMAMQWHKDYPKSSMTIV